MKETKVKRIVCRVDDSDKARIEILAVKCGLTTSEYLRKRALGYEPKPVLTDVFFDFYQKLCDLINTTADDEIKEKALNLFDKIHTELFRERKQKLSEIREEVKDVGNDRILAGEEQS